jgi:hypothetical protein
MKLEVDDTVCSEPVLRDNASLQMGLSQANHPYLAIDQIDGTAIAYATRRIRNWSLLAGSMFHPAGRAQSRPQVCLAYKLNVRWPRLLGRGRYSRPRQSSARHSFDTTRGGYIDKEQHTGSRSIMPAAIAAFRIDGLVPASLRSF